MAEYELIKEYIIIRKEQKISQKEIAEKLGTKQQAISRIENGKLNPTLSFFISLLNILGYKLTITKK